MLSLVKGYYCSKLQLRVINWNFKFPGRALYTHMFYTNNVYKKNFTYEGLIKRIINPVNLKQNNREFKN